VLALGIQTPQSTVIMDERRGRLYAETLGLKVTGTLGILLRAKMEARTALVAPLLEQLEGLGFRLAAATRDAVLRQAGE
jgi:uncharacterized protein